MTTDAATVARRNRRRTLVLWVLQVLVALFFLTAAALPKLFGEQTAVEMFDDIGWGDWFRYCCGVCELAGAVGLVIPRLAGLAASCLIALLAGAVVFLVFVLDDPQLVVTPIILAVPLAFIARGLLADTDLRLRAAAR